MKPGVSARYRSGIAKASQVQMNSAAFSAASGKIAPARWAGWLATIPTGRPSIRAKPVRISVP